jgi:molecular chaperone HscA
MLQDSVTHSGEDAQARALNEQRVEADRMVEAVTAAIDADADLLSAVELAEIRLALDTLNGAVQGSERRAIMSALERINKITEPFASRRMDRSIHRALSGKKLEDMNI